jgi:hypothetical protein
MAETRLPAQIFCGQAALTELTELARLSEDGFYHLVLHMLAEPMQAGDATGDPDPAGDTTKLVQRRGLFSDMEVPRPGQPAVVGATNLCPRSGAEI